MCKHAYLVKINQLFIPGNILGNIWQDIATESSQQVWAKKKHEKKKPLSEKKTQFQQKKALFSIISFLLHKISPFNMFKTINYLFFNISKTSYFTKQQTPLVIIISHNFKEMIFFIRID